MKKSIYSKRYDELCLLLTEARKSAKLTQQQLAEKIAKPQSFIAKYEIGERRLDVIEFLAITDALNADPVKIIKAVRRQ